MPLHRNESSGQKSLNFSGRDQSCFVKENHHLPREICTVMTIASSSNQIKTPSLEFVFKGKGKRVKLNPPDKVTIQWTEKGSYRLENALKYVESLPSIPVNFAPEKRCIFTLDDYSAHLAPEVEEAFRKKGYFLIVIGGGITGDIQVNDTSYHRQAKAAHRNHEMKLMLEMLEKDPIKIPTPNRDQMMQMFQESWNETCANVNNEFVFKTNMITLALDGSEDHLASRKLMDLIGNKMLEFRENLLSSKPAATLKELHAQMIKPEGVRMKGQTAKVKAPPDEGLELVDGDGEDLDVDYLEDLEDNSQENEEGTDGDEQGTNYENTNLVENLECEDDNMPISNNTEVMNTNDLQLLQKINDTFCHVKKECSNTLLPFLVQIEGVAATARRKLLKDAPHIDSIIKETLSEIASSSKVSQKDEEEHHEENCFEMFD